MRSAEPVKTVAPARRSSFLRTGRGGHRGQIGPAVENVLKQDAGRDIRFLENRAVGGVLEQVEPLHRGLYRVEIAAREIGIGGLVVPSDKEIDRKPELGQTCAQVVADQVVPKNGRDQSLPRQMLTFSLRV